MIVIDKTVEGAKETLGLSFAAYDSMVQTRDNAQAEINDIIEVMGNLKTSAPGVISYFESIYLTIHKMSGSSFLGMSFSEPQDTNKLIIDNMRTSKVLYPDSLNPGVDDVTSRMNFDINNSYLNNFGMTFKILKSLSTASISDVISSIKTPITSDDGGSSTYSFTTSEKESIENVYNQFKDLLSDSIDEEGNFYTVICNETEKFLAELNLETPSVAVFMSFVNSLLGYISNLRNQYNVIASISPYSGRSSYDSTLVSYCNLFESQLGIITAGINSVLDEAEKLCQGNSDIRDLWRFYFTRLNIRPSGAIMTLDGAITAISSLENQIEQNLFQASFFTEENCVLPTPKIEAIYKREDENGEEKYFLSFSAIPCYTSIVLRSLSPFDIFPIKTWDLDEIINFSEVELPEEILTMGREYRFILSRSPYSSTAVTFDFSPSTNLSFDF